MRRSCLIPLPGLGSPVSPVWADPSLPPW
jgi:hypothetical protein